MQRRYELKLVCDRTIRLFGNHGIIYHISLLSLCPYKDPTLVERSCHRHNRHNGVQEKDIVTEQGSQNSLSPGPRRKPTPADKETTQSGKPSPGCSEQASTDKEGRRRGVQTPIGSTLKIWDLETGQQLAWSLGEGTAWAGRAQDQWKKRGLNMEIQNRSVSLRLLHHAGCDV